MPPQVSILRTPQPTSPTYIRSIPKYPINMDNSKTVVEFLLPYKQTNTILHYKGSLLNWFKQCPRYLKAKQHKTTVQTMTNAKYLFGFAGS